jgi:sortase A
MKIVIIHRPFRVHSKTLSWWAQTILLIVGMAALGLWGAVSLSTCLFQKREKAYLARTSVGYHGPQELPPLPSNNGDLIGEIDIPAVGISAVILEGSDEHTLRLGVGHLRGTAFPGDEGNVTLAGHRDTFFRPLRKILKNDVIRLITFNNSYNYRVDWARVVSPDDIDVLKPLKKPVLTLITCYPFYFVGPAPERFIVRAHRVAG